MSHLCRRWSAVSKEGEGGLNLRGFICLKLSVSLHSLYLFYSIISVLNKQMCVYIHIHRIYIYIYIYTVYIYMTCACMYVYSFTKTITL